MKTKKTAKIISSVLALVMLVCSLSAVSGFVTSAENEANTEAELVNALKTSWTKMYTNDFFATLKSDENVGSVNVNNDTVNDNITIDENKTYATGDEVLGLNLNANYYVLTFYDKGGRYQCYTLSDKVKNYDTITLSFYTGQITQKGRINIGVVNKIWNTESIKLDLDITDSEKWFNVDILKSLGYADMNAFLNRASNDDIPNAMNVSFENALKSNGVIIGMVAGKTFAKLPDKSDSMTALELYNEAKNINVANYIDSADFIAARVALGEYLRSQILKNELTTAWGSMYQKTGVAELKTDAAASGLTGNKSYLNDMGIVFGENNLASKSASEHTETQVGLIFKNSDNSGSFWFDNSTNNRGPKYADVFNDGNYDDLIVTIKLGEVTAEGTVYFNCTYLNWQTVISDKLKITPSDSNTTITLKATELFGKQLSDLLSKSINNGTSPLHLFKIGFSQSLAFNNTEISGLSAINYAAAPSDVTNDELLAGQARRVKVSTFENTAEFDIKRTEYCNYFMTGKTLGNVNGLDNVDICDLVALNDLVTSKDYNKDTTYSITGDMNTDGYITAADTALLRAKLLG